jgi:hypothetical protein
MSSSIHNPRLLALKLIQQNHLKFNLEKYVCAESDEVDHMKLEFPLVEAAMASDVFHD